MIARTTAAILNRYGFRTQYFTSPEQALAAAKIAPPDALLSDVFMPSMSGVELAIAVRQQLPQCSIILISAHARVRDVVKPARERGFDFLVLAKPVLPSDILRELNKSLGPGLAQNSGFGPGPTPHTQFAY
jgi:DNA-binding NtrC family response regulator